MEIFGHDLSEFDPRNFRFPTKEKKPEPQPEPEATKAGGFGEIHIGGATQVFVNGVEQNMAGGGSVKIAGGEIQIGSVGSTKWKGGEKVAPQTKKPFGEETTTVTQSAGEGSKQYKEVQNVTIINGKAELR